MAAAVCDSGNIKTLLGQIKNNIAQDDEANKKMIEYLEGLDYTNDEDLNFISLIIGRIINEKQIDNLPNIDALKNCATNTNINNCDILLLKLIKQSINALTVASELKPFLEECERNYPKLSYHLKMRIQYILYRNIYKIPASPLNTEVLRKEFVNFFDKRCLNAQYRNILYQDEKYISDNINTVIQTNFDGFNEKLRKSIFNISNDPATFKSLKTDGTTELTINDFASLNTVNNKAELKAIFDEKMRIMGGNKGVHMYHLCSSSVNISLKKVQAKTAREGAKIMARKLLNKSGNKSVKFSLKRMIGNKEKYYNYQASIDKSGKISIKST
jgi:hypothetical protein